MTGLVANIWIGFLDALRGGYDHLIETICDRLGKVRAHTDAPNHHGRVLMWPRISGGLGSIEGERYAEWTCGNRETIRVDVRTVGSFHGR